MANTPLYLNTAMLEMLHKLPMFSMFSEAELRRMIYSGKFLRIDRFCPEDVIIQEGSFGRWVYVLLKGAVKVVKKNIEICTLTEQGTILGEIGAIQSQVRSASVIALEPCFFIAIDISVIEHMSGHEKQEYIQRIKDFLSPMIQERLAQTMEISSLIEEIRCKRNEIDHLQQRLRALGASEEKSILQLLLEGEKD